MNRIMWLYCIGACFALSTTKAQSVRSLVNGGNDLYKDQKYTDAEVNYRKALEKDREQIPGRFNLGNALNKQGKYDEAVKEYGSVIDKAGTKDVKAESYFNVGNSWMKQQKYQEAIQSYIESLKLDPNDQDAKYNLSYALRMLRQQQQQQQQQNKDKKNQDKKNQDKKQDQNKNDHQQQNQQDQQKKDQNQQQKPQQNQQQQNPSQQEKKMSKADAERILDVLKNNEKDVQKKLRVRQAVRPRTEKDW